MKMATLNSERTAQKKEDAKTIAGRLVISFVLIMVFLGSYNF